MKTIKAAVMAALVAGGLTLGGTQEANAQGFSLSFGRGGFYAGPSYGYGYGGVYGRSYGYYPSYGYRSTYVYPSYGYSSYRYSPGYYGGHRGYAYPGYGFNRWDNDWDRGDWRRFNRRLERRFDWDD